MSAPRSRLAHSLLRWLRRYLPAELVSTPCALIGGVTATQWTGSAAAGAIAATWGENLGFYCAMLVRELARRGGVRALPCAMRDLFLEFGPAEAVDLLLVRPASLYAGLSVAPHPALGIVMGKVVADVSFYSFAIVSHELQRWYARASEARPAPIRRLLLPAFGALVCLSLATASFAQSLTGTWHGSLVCKDERTKQSGGTTSDLLITQPGGPGTSELRVEQDGQRSYGILFPPGGAVMLPPGTTSGLGFLVACTSHPDASYSAIFPMRWKVDEDGGGSLKLSGTYSSYYGHGSCKGSFQRTSTTDPDVSASCP